MPKKPYKVFGKTYPSLKNAAESHGINVHTVLKRLQNGWSVSKTFKTPVKNSRTSFAGKLVEIDGKTASVHDHCRLRGIKVNTVKRRVDRGMSLPQAITCPLYAIFEDTNTSVYTIKHIATGKLYVGLSTKPETRWKTHQKDAKHRKHQPLYQDLIKFGPEAFEFKVLQKCETMAEAQAMEKDTIAVFGTQHPNGYNLSAGGQFFGNGKEYEAVGNLFPNKQAALDYYGVSDVLVKGRMRAGWPRDLAFTAPKGHIHARGDMRKPITTKVVEVFGVKYPSMAALARAYDMNVVTLLNRINKKNMTPEQAVSLPIFEGKYPKKVTLNGVEYPSLKALALAHNLHPNMISHRLLLGVSIERAVNPKRLTKYDY